MGLEVDLGRFSSTILLVMGMNRGWRTACTTGSGITTVNKTHTMKMQELFATQVYSSLICVPVALTIMILSTVDDPR